MTTVDAITPANNRRFEVEIAPVERVHLWTDSLVAADFDCPPSHPRFRGSGPLMAPCLGWSATQSIMLVDGVGEIVVDPMSVVLLPGGTCYERRAIAGSADVAEVVGISPGFFAALLEGMGIDPDGMRPMALPVSIMDLLDVRSCFAGLRSGTQPDQESEADVLDIVMRTLEQHAIRIGGNVEPGRNPEARNLLERARVSALAQCPPGSPLKTVADELGITPEHLCRVSRRVLGIPFGRYVLQLRLRRALDLMRRSDLGLLDIALECGFSSHPHFSNSFHKVFGDYPSGVRKRLRAA